MLLVALLDVTFDLSLKGNGPRVGGGELETAGAP